MTTAPGVAARAAIVPGESFRASALGPIPVLDRVEIIDVLRGFALSGVLLANMVWLSQEVALTSAQVAALPTADIDRWSRYLVQFLIDGKFVTLFAFLFGLGFSVQLVRAEVRGTSVVPVYTRRLLILLAFGAMHTCLLWYGDILLFYALLGFPLILFRFRAERTLLICGVALAVAVPVLVLAIQGGMAIGGDAAAAALASAEDTRVKAERFAAFTTGTYLDVLQENAKVNSDFWLAGIFLFALPTTCCRRPSTCSSSTDSASAWD
jgi:uncharacterized protein